jgi:hypothetical protein
VSTQQRTKRADLPVCYRCKAAVMADILSIAPTLHQPGLIAMDRCDLQQQETGQQCWL